MIKAGNIFILLFLSYLVWLSSCANITQPQGGPKDTIPPLLINSVPPHNSLNFNNKEIKLTFNEYIKLKDLNNQLIITPRIDEEYRHKLNKNVLTLLFENKLDSNTTYTFNFIESVQDITEGNPSRDLVLAFSTGSYIDSLSISGQVKELITNKPVDGAVVTIYDSSDTLDIFNSKPDYFTKTNEQGIYKIENIKNGQYKIYAFNDKNKNLKSEPLSEAYGFLSKPIDLNESKDSITIKLQKLDIRDFKIQSKRPDGKYYQVKFNKYVMDYDLEFNGPDSLPSNPVETNKTVRIYNTLNITDSIQARIKAIDTIGQAIRDTFYVKFPETKRSKAEVQSNFTPASGKKIEENFEGVFIFNKPIRIVNSDSIFFKYDSLIIEKLDPEKNFTWNKFKDRLTIKTTLDKSLIEKRIKEKAEKNILINRNEIDTTNTIENTLSSDRPLRGNLSGSKTRGKQEGLRLYLARGTFVTVENDTIQAIENFYDFKKAENNGIIKGEIETDKESFIIQLLDKDYNIIDEIKNKKNYTFNNVPPGEYLLRIMIDNNKNGVWDAGNIKKQQEPEDIIFYPDPISIRANWELENTKWSF